MKQSAMSITIKSKTNERIRQEKNYTYFWYLWVDGNNDDKSDEK